MHTQCKFRRKVMTPHGAVDEFYTAWIPSEKAQVDRIVEIEGFAVDQLQELCRLLKSVMTM